MTELEQVLVEASVPGAVVVRRCGRCLLLRAPGPDAGLHLCRACLREVFDLFPDNELTPVVPGLYFLVDTANQEGRNSAPISGA